MIMSFNLVVRKNMNFCILSFTILKFCTMSNTSNSSFLFLLLWSLYCEISWIKLVLELPGGRTYFEAPNWCAQNKCREREHKKRMQAVDRAPRRHASVMTYIPWPVRILSCALINLQKILNLGFLIGLKVLQNIQRHWCLYCQIDFNCLSAGFTP